MSITEPANPDLPLAQGDILQRVALFQTGDDWQRQERVGGGMLACLLISRPCVIANKTRVVVAGVERYGGNPPSTVQTFRDVLDFLLALRDGRSAPDRFYLGQIPSLGEGRYHAVFDCLFTLCLPTGSDARAALIREHRVARLGAEFIRDLHTRIFTSIAVQGFDDFRWYSDNDLRWLVSKGNEELAAAQAAFDKAQAGGFQSPKQREELGRDLQKKKSAVEPFDQELGRRKTSSKS